jgi:hypothetical protein
VLTDTPWARSGSYGFFHPTLTASTVAYPAPAAHDRILAVDLVFILGLVVLLAATHWLILAISRLGRLE